ncbi:hypothetical protein [Aeromonas sp. MdU4]|uniref:hypothetical protein n=1 Tax=Aeromonas sp. MdU4 TaxID=3342819 RepID=UPI0035B7BB3A
MLRLRLRLEAQLSFRQISICTKVSVGSIQKLLKSAQALGLTWPLPTELDDGRLAALFYPQADTTISARHVVLGWPSVHQELKRKGVSKQLLWEEYTQRYPNSCYSYSQFCDRYKSWCQLQKRSMRQIGVVSQIYCQATTAPAPNNRYTRGFLTGIPRVFSLFMALTYAMTSPTWLL